MINDFDWVIKILSSCKKEEHINVSDNIFENFRKKWSENIEDSVMDIVFSKKYQSKKQEILKSFFI